jgi:hypothetical protein
MKAVCVECKNIIITGAAIPFRYHCKTGKTNYITGGEEIKPCIALNKDGSCQRFTPKSPEPSKNRELIENQIPNRWWHLRRTICPNKCELNNP